MKKESQFSLKEEYVAPSSVMFRLSLGGAFCKSAINPNDDSPIEDYDPVEDDDNWY